MSAVAAGRLSARLTALDGPAHRVVAGFVGAERLAAELAECVDRVRWTAESAPLLFSRQLGALASGGKRLRPLLVLAAAHSASAAHVLLDRDRAIGSAVVVELLHLASLVHDDVLDEAGTRHGTETVNAREGNLRAVLAGDYLLAQALATACTLGRTEGSVAARTFVRLCEGQAQESASLFDTGRPESAYFAGIEGKTGALFEASCALGALAGGLGPRAASALGEYGMRLGTAFQLLDDCLDFTASAEQLGKPAGHDIVEGVYTLPVLRTLRRRPELARVLSRPDRAAAAAEAVALVRDGDAIAETRAEAHRQAVRAVDALSGAAHEIDALAVDMLAALAETLAPGSPDGRAPATACPVRPDQARESIR